MDKREMTEKLLNLISFTDMIDRKNKSATDGEPTFCDTADYRESRSILEEAAISILTMEKKI